MIESIVDVRMMKKALGLFWVTMYVLTLSGCGMIVNPEGMQTTENEIIPENTASFNLDDVVTQRDKYEQYCDYLGQVTEKNFMNEEGIQSADATVTYDEETDQYAIELSIETNGELGEDQIALYKSILSEKYEYAEVVLAVDGEVM